MSNKMVTTPEIDVEKIEVYNNRRLVEKKVKELMETISKEGLLQPICVAEAEKKGFYELVCGGHRLEAYKRLGKTKIKATFYEGNNILAARAIENNLRSETSLAEKVDQIKQLQELTRQVVENEQFTPPKNLGDRKYYLDLAKSKPSKKSLQEHVSVKLFFFKNHETSRQAIRVAEYCIDDVLQKIDEDCLSIHKAYMDIVKCKIKREKQLDALRKILASPDSSVDKTMLRDSEKKRQAEKRKVKSKPAKLPKQKAANTYSIIYAAPVIKTPSFDEVGWANRYAITWDGQPMPALDICTMPVESIANAHNCLLLLKVASPLLQDGLEILDSWGFCYVNMFGVAEPQITLPHTPGIIRYPHDVVLIGTIGKWSVEPDVTDGALTELSDGLSNGVLELAEKWYPKMAKVKIFDNRTRSGWDNWFEV